MNMLDNIHILIVEDSPSDALLIGEAFYGIHDFEYELKYAETLTQALNEIRQTKIHVVLLDLGLPDSQGIDTFQKFYRQNSELPVLVLTALEDISIGLQALSEGAQDYLIKRNIVPTELGRAIRYAIERQEPLIELQRSRDQFRKLALHLQTVREQERTRISREIHDELGQKMSALKMDVKWLEARLMQTSESDHQVVMRKRLLDSEQLIDKSIEAIQRIAIELRPGVLDHLGLIDAIRDESRRFEANTGISILLELPHDLLSTDQEISTTFFRIFQELLTNVARHANAHAVTVKFTHVDQELALEVTDDGIGMPANIKSPYTSLGLLGMFERVLSHQGRMEINSAPGKGARVTASIPCKL